MLRGSNQNPSIYNVVIQLAPGSRGRTACIDPSLVECGFLHPDKSRKVTQPNHGYITDRTIWYHTDCGIHLPAASDRPVWVVPVSFDLNDQDFDDVWRFQLCSSKALLVTRRDFLPVD